MTLKIKAPAKINLYLDVLDKRPDGYHNVKSIMQAVSLYDTVTVSESDTIAVTCTSREVPTDNRNLAYKAAEAFFAAAGIVGGAKIHIEKSIPVAGGLAGGSTDAAAVLSALNSIYKEPLTKEQMLCLGARLGADVPFCLEKGCAVCRGIGDILSPVASVLILNIVIANGGESVSTPAAYKLLDEKYGNELCRDFGNLDGVLEAIKQNDLMMLKKYAYNIFEEAVLPTHTCASGIKEEMYRCGAILSMMSGSGPSVFGFFDSAETANVAAEKIRQLGFNAQVCETLH